MPLTDTAHPARSSPRSRPLHAGATSAASCVEVFPTGGVLWHYRYRLNGKQERADAGPATRR
ncbi:MAG: Arm DNA-binding domain-containing protein [Comamonadaceae bacterium]|nr:Arm DNA-binding domain-containing protein [Comamonadaceae bacterium]